MQTNWLNKLDEQKLVGFELSKDSEIVWTRKTQQGENENLEIILIQGVSNYEWQAKTFIEYFKGICEKEIYNNNVEKVLTERQFGIDEYINLEYDSAHPATTFFEYARENGFEIQYICVDNDFGHIKDFISSESIGQNGSEIQQSFSNKFVNLLEQFFFHPYYCEAKIYENELKKDEINKSLRIGGSYLKISNYTKADLEKCERNIEVYKDELLYYQREQALRDLNKLCKESDKLIEEMDAKYSKINARKNKNNDGMEQ